MFVDPVRVAIYRLAPGPVKAPQDLMYLRHNARAMGHPDIDAGAYEGVASMWNRGQLTEDALAQQLEQLKVAEVLGDRSNEMANRVLNGVWSGVLAAGIPAVGAGLGASAWNAGVNSDWEINAGDVARAMALAGAVGGAGLWAAERGTGRRLGWNGQGLGFMTPDQRHAYLQAEYDRRHATPV